MYYGSGNAMKTIQTLMIVLAILATPVLIAAASPLAVSAIECGGVTTAILECGGDKNATTVENSGIWHILLLVLNIMTGLVGILAVGGIVYASILYATAQDNGGQVTKAKETIFNVILGVVCFALMYSFLQFLIPGGIFN